MSEGATSTESHMFGMEDTMPGLPIKISDMDEIQYTKLSVYRRMIEIGLESIIFSAIRDKNTFFKEKTSVEDLEKQHKEIQDSFDKLLKDAHRLTSEPAKVDKIRIDQLLNDYKWKVSKFLDALDF